MSTIELWIGGYGPEESAHGEGLRTFRDHVTSATNHEVAVKITWNIMDQGRPNTDLFDLVEAGEMFFCYFSTSYLCDRVRELNVLETPFLFDDLLTAHRALDGSLGTALRQAVRERSDFEALGFWDNGFRHMTNRIRPIIKPEDCVGMKVRMQPNAIHEELIRCWGAVPVAVELSEAIRQLRSGEVDAQENPLANTVAYGVDGLHPYVTMTGHLYGARGLFANRDLYQSLPDDVRQIVDSGVAKAISAQRDAAAQLEDDLRTRMETAGVHFVDLSAEERAVFESEAAPAIAMARELAPRALFAMAGR